MEASVPGEMKWVKYFHSFHLIGMTECQEGLLVTVNDRLAALSSHSSASSDSVTPMSMPVSASSIQLARPEKSSGESGDCWVFLTHCELHFELQADLFINERAKIAFLISHLTGKVDVWARVEWARRSHICESFATFSQMFSRIFQCRSPGREAVRCLICLRKGNHKFMYYASDFCTLAADSGGTSTH